ncbi:MAG: arylsulfotransferase family protein [Parvularculaceae bacterium]
MIGDKIEQALLKTRTIRAQTWVFGVIGWAVIFFLLAFGALVEDAARAAANRNETRFGVVADAALAIARIPVTAKQVVSRLGKNDLEAREQRFDGVFGFERAPASHEDDRSAVIIARYDNDAARSVAELVSLSDGAVLHKYEPPIDELIARSDLSPDQVDYANDKNPHRFMISHPLLEADGSILFHGMYTPIVKVDRCSRIVWIIDRVFHHSIERGPDGAYWTIEKPSNPRLKYVGHDYADDKIVKFSPNGKVLFERSITDIFIKNGLSSLVYGQGAYQDEVFHANDVQPVMADGVLWKKGDLFLSLRNRSMIALYRPSTDKIIWKKAGPWMMQHDVDILDDHRIAIFSNNAVTTPYGERVAGNNETIIYDFATKTTSSPFRKAFKKLDIRTVSEGRSEILEDGGVFIEEQNYGRLVRLNSVGDLDWQYVNRASDGKVYLVRWSRFVPEAELAAQRPILSQRECEAVGEQVTLTKQMGRQASGADERG